MSLRKTVRLVATGAFVLMLVPVVGDFFVEIARENGLYSKPTERVQAVVNWAQSIFGEQSFFWLLFGLGGLAAGLWLDVVLKRGEPEKDDPVAKMAARMGMLVGMMPSPLTGDWGPVSPKGTSWRSEIAALYFLMEAADFRAPPIDLNPDKWANLDAHAQYLAHIFPFIEGGDINEAKAVNYMTVAKMLGDTSFENAPIYERPSLFRRLLGAKPKLLSPPDTEPETQP